MKKFITIIILFMTTTSQANISLPSIFGNHMVMQQNSEVKIWGWADPNEEITITTSWNSEEIKTTGNNLAQWSAILKTPKSGKTHTITIQGYNKIIIEDILMGEVWLCSGQSNMQWSASAGIDDKEKHIANANYPEIRFFSVPKKTSDYPQLDVKAQWVKCSPETMQYFSAVSYFFGQKIHSELNVPVGLINSSWGGTPAEIWVPKDAIEANEIVNEASKKLKEEPWGPFQPGKAYNAMIAPIIPFKIAGTLWYQGETNTQNSSTYSKLLTTLINSWRDEWNEDFPFYFAQIAPFDYGDDNFSGVEIRDQQRRVLNVDKTGMIVLSDIGNLDDIHPQNKYDVGIRFANLALNKSYGKSNFQYSGPLYKSSKIKKDCIIISFDFYDGLTSMDKKLRFFEIAGSDGVFFPADAKIKGKTIEVKSKEVKNPVKVRYAWKNAIIPTLTNSTGLPASSFITD
ncbi:sialate O-acetylesterase [Urechidicola croceus]|uniref:Sialate O-acetylesterase n=1 Tax=Urechidicola croceus TaxID=1850246 RepID=A0A1D8P4W1_9FLAO|nr:sialate O-acetylesterase [Urechidicola croceus]AOW19629.1 sialate O-acetylesterase [Urechidicola croceus]